MAGELPEVEPGAAPSLRHSSWSVPSGAWSYWVTAALLALLGCLIVVGGTWYSVSTRSSVRSNSTSSESGDHSDTIETAILAQHTAVRQSQLIGAQADLRQTEKELNSLQGSVSRWNRILAELSTNGRGRRIAADSPSLERFLVLRDLQQPDASMVTTLGERMAVVRRQIDQAGQNDTVLLPATTEVAAVRAEAVEFLIVYERHHQTLEALLRDAPAAPPRGMSLQLAIASHTAHQTVERQRTIDRLTAQAQTQMDEQLADLRRQKADAEAQLAELQPQLDLARVASVAAITVERTQTTAAATARQQEQLLVRAAFRQVLPQIRKTLTPFITPGYVQPTSAYQLSHTIEKTPLSYTALKRVGALEDSQAGLELLFRIGGSKRPSDSNDRPLGTFPQHVSPFEIQKPEVLRRLQTAQQLLRDYGEQMVKDGLLAP